MKKSEMTYEQKIKNMQTTLTEQKHTCESFLNKIYTLRREISEKTHEIHTKTTELEFIQNDQNLLLEMLENSNATKTTILTSKYDYNATTCNDLSFAIEKLHNDLKQLHTDLRSNYSRLNNAFTVRSQIVTMLRAMHVSCQTEEN